MPPNMTWLPVDSHFRPGLAAAIDSPNSADCLEAPASLAQCRLGYLETIQLDRALDRALARSASKSQSPFPTVRLAILSSSTVNHLAPAIRIAGLRRRLLIDVNIGQYGQYRRDLLDPNSALHQFSPHLVLLSISARPMINELQLAATSSEVDEKIARSIE